MKNNLKPKKKELTICKKCVKKTKCNSMFPKDILCGEAQLEWSKFINADPERKRQALKHFDEKNSVGSLQDKRNRRSRKVRFYI